ncbi:hypothetical protein V6N11_063180 [Hibiscus sabdariffa]|uniref:Uncharacterized protein n=1 Tax=Hibiscus sabdariffa TaxID=183260 RepID=A0ABR2NX75_9ROSI
MVFEIGVVELAFADNSNAVEGKNDYTYKEYGEDVKELESVTYTTMEKDKNMEETFKEGCDGVEGRRSVGEVIKDDDSSKAGGLAQVETGEKVTIIAVGLADYVGDPNLDGLVGLDVQDAK